MDFQVYDIALIPLIVFLVAVFVPDNHKKRYAPAASIFLGVVAGFVYLAPGDPKEAVILGLALGMAAVASHSGTKNFIETLRK